MSLLKWDASPHWKVKHEPQTNMAVLEPEPEPFIEAELPTLTSPRTSKEITEAILDDPRYNAINPSNQQHIIERAIALAETSGMLIAEVSI